MPLNRLSDQSLAANALKKIMAALMPYYQASRAEISTEAYLGWLQEKIEGLIVNRQILTGNHKDHIRDFAQGLGLIIRQGAPENLQSIPTTVAHGDFQPANILLDGESPWLIDWEYSSRRQAGYDALVYGLSARFPTGLAARAAVFVETGGFTAGDPSLQAWPEVSWETKRKGSLPYVCLHWRNCH